MSTYAYINGDNAVKAIKYGFEHKAKAKAYSDTGSEELVAILMEWVKLPVLPVWIEGSMFIYDKELHLSIKCNRYYHEVIQWLKDNDIRYELA